MWITLAFLAFLVLDYIVYIHNKRKQWAKWVRGEMCRQMGDHWKEHGVDYDDAWYRGLASQPKEAEDGLLAKGRVVYLVEMPDGSWWVHVFAMYPDSKVVPALLVEVHRLPFRPPNIHIRR